MQRFFCLFIIFPICIFSNWKEHFQEKKDPAIVHHVDVTTGALFLHFTDHLSKGAVPLSIDRAYTSNYTPNKKHSKWDFIGGWRFFPHTNLYVEGEKAEVTLPSGREVTFFLFSKKGNKVVYRVCVREDQKLGVMSYRSNGANDQLIFDTKERTATLVFADGSTYFYRGKKKRLRDKVNPFWKGVSHEYVLEEQTTSSCQKILYSYENGGNTLVLTQMNPSKTKVFGKTVVEIKKTKQNFLITVSEQGQREMSYYGKNLDQGSYLEWVQKEGLALEKFGYTHVKKGDYDLLETLSLEGREPLKVVYEDKGRRVKEIYEGGQRLALFIYEPHLTKVVHLVGYSSYHHLGGALSKVEHFDHKNNLVRAEKFVWKGGNLVAKVICDRQGKGIYSKTFAYDSDKNLIKETLYGRITGEGPLLFEVEEEGGLQGAESLSTSYKYNDKHLLIEEKEEGGVVYEYSYFKESDLVASKRTKEGETLLFEEVYVYDEDFFLIEKRCFDGYYESVERMTLDPQTKMVLKNEDGLSTLSYTYDDRYCLIKEDNGKACIENEYDRYGRIISKTFPCGGKNHYLYDRYGNLEKVKKVGEPWKTIEYDSLNRPVACEVEGRKSTMRYDRYGNVLSEVDYKGAQKSFEYDLFHRCIKKRFPEVQEDGGKYFTPEYHYKYDIQGNLIYEKAPSGGETFHTYTVLGKLLTTVFPDGGNISHLYYSNGDLKETLDEKGIKFTYTYDALHRLIKKTEGDVEEQWEYEGVFLKKYIDPRGSVTHYFYDSHGRKTLEECGGREKEFFYDELGRLYQERSRGGVYTKIYDVEGKVIKTDQNGYNKIFYEYDEENRKSKAICVSPAGKVCDQFFYDSRGRMICHVDPLEQKTEFIYEDYSRTVIDPLGNYSIERFDPLMRVIEKERQNPFQETVFLEKFTYDRAGNVKRRFVEGYPIEVEFFYDLQGRVIKEVESHKKVTTYRYDHKGRRVRKTSPNGVFFTYTYDDLDRIKKMKSSDGTVFYEYIYKGVDLCEIKDHCLHKSIHFSYTPFGEISQECGFDGYKTSWYYDTFGRTKKMVLPDGSGIEYSYQGHLMEKVSRIDKDQNLLYEHLYTEFDNCSHVVEEETIDHLGKILTVRDVLERPYRMRSLYHDQYLEYNEKSLISEKGNSFTKKVSYSYDFLDQLTQEGESITHFDAIGNLKDHKINDLNQIISTGNQGFLYDGNGNLIKRKGVGYSFDALNRLTEIFYKEGKKVRFCYDPLSRLYSKEIFQQGVMTEKKIYLYNNQYEIGSMNEEGKIVELKVLGLGVQHDIGAAISIEIEEQVYLPLHDLQGNIIALVDRSGEVVESYDFTAFGEEKGFNGINPWRFQSKRSEEGLIFFGCRFYDPPLKRWMSPDPLGFCESINLYVYVLNNPVNRLDIFGLESTSLMFMPQNIEPNFSFGQTSYAREYFGYFGESGQTETKYTIGNFNGDKALMRWQFPADTLFRFSPEEVKNGCFDIFNHLPELIEGCDDKCAFFSYMNGINNSPKDFAEMGEVISSLIPKRSLLIGIYNKTFSPTMDLGRVGIEALGFNTKSTRVLKCFNQSLLDIMEKHTKNAYYLHIAHSEGVLIAARAYERMSENEQKLMKKYASVLGVGGARPIKDEYTHSSLNIYSMLDLVTGFSAIAYSEGCKTKWLTPTSPWSERMGYFIEHSFSLDTYKGGVEEYIKSCKSRGKGIHEVRQR